MTRLRLSCSASWASIDLRSTAAGLAPCDKDELLLQGALFIETRVELGLRLVRGFRGGEGRGDGHADQMDGIVLFLVSVCELQWEI